MIVRRLEADEAEAAGHVLTASHADYPAFRHLFPDSVKRERLLRTFMSATALDAVRHGLALGAFEGEDMMGTALWMPPGTFPLSPTRKAKMTPALMKAAAVAGRSFWAFARVGSALEKDHPPDPAWYLQALGVRPSAQRKGVGGRLVAPVLALADESGTACHLHTSDPSNVAYYARFGFELVNQVTPLEGGPAYASMVRRPRDSSTSDRG